MRIRLKAIVWRETEAPGGRAGTLDSVSHRKGSAEIVPMIRALCVGDMDTESRENGSIKALLGLVSWRPGVSVPFQGLAGAGEGSGLSWYWGERGARLSRVRAVGCWRPGGRG